MTATRLARAALLAATAALAVGACASNGNTTSDAVPTAASATTTATPEPPRAQKADMRIEISISGQLFTATLGGGAASHDLVSQLPLTVEMVDHGGVEKTGPLPSPLSLDGQPAGADPGVGDLGYYAPGGDVVLYYGDQSYFTGIVVLGRMEGDAAERIAAMEGPVTATLTPLDE